MPVLASRYTAPRGSYSGNVFYKRLKDMGDRYENLYTGATSNLAKQIAVLKNATTSKNKIRMASIKIREMANNEFKKEQDFLTEMFGANLNFNSLYEPNGIQELIKIINATMRFESIFERNKTILQKNVNDKGKIVSSRNIGADLGNFYIDIWNEKVQNEDFKNQILAIIKEAIFSEDSYNKNISEEIDKIIEQKKDECFNELLDKLSNGDILEKYYKNNSISEEEKKAYNEFVNGLREYKQILQVFKMDFLKALGLDQIDEYLNLKENIYNKNNDLLTKKGELKQKFIRLKKKAIKDKKGASTYQANIFEILGNALTSVATVMNSENKDFDFKTYHMGEAQSTPDNIYMYNYNGELTDTFEKLTSSLSMNNRPFNISIYNKIGEQLKKIQGAYIIYTSDKNYILDYAPGGGEFMGFSAGSAKNISTIAETIEAAGQANSDMITNIGINLLPGAIGEGNDEYLKKYITFNIAAFLFDDFTTIGEYNKNEGKALHIFDLDGIYIPLSAFLFKLAEAINSAEKDIENILVIDLSYPSIMFPEPGTGTGKWAEQREKALTGVKVSIHFLKGIRELLAGTL